MIGIKSAIQQSLENVGAKPIDENLVTKVAQEEKEISLPEILDFETADKQPQYGPLGKIDFESGDVPVIPEYIEEQGPEVYDDLIKPTAKAMVKVPAAFLASMALLPGAGIRAGIELIPTINPDPTSEDFFKYGTIENAMKVYDQIMKVPSELITTTEEAKAIENISKVFKPIEMAGEGWRLIGEKIEQGLKELDLPSGYIEPLLATMGEAAAVFASGEVVGKLKSSNWYRSLAVKERGLVVQSLAETMKRNPEMTEGQLLRAYDNPTWRAEALGKRSIGEQYAKVKNYAEVKTREAAVEGMVKLKKNMPKKETTEVPVRKEPEYSYISKKGNYFEKSGDKWFNEAGKEVVNAFTIKALERGKQAIKPAEEEPKVDLNEKFRVTDPESNDAALKGTEKLSKVGDIDSLKNSLEAEINSWADGKDVNIANVKDFVDEMTETFDKYTEGTESIDGTEFSNMTLTEIENNREYFNELSQWIEELDRAKIEQAKKLYYGTNIENLKSGKDLPTGHRGYFLTDSPKVASKFGKVYVADLANINIFDARKSGEAEKLLSAYKKYSSVPNESMTLQNIKNGGFGFYERPTVKYALEDLGYEGNWQVEDGANVIRILNKEKITTFTPHRKSNTQLYSGIPLDKIGTELKSLYRKLTGKDKVRSVDPVVAEPFTIKYKGKELVRTRRSKLDLASYDTNKFVNTLDQKLSGKQKEVMPFVIEKTSIPKELGRKDLEKVLAKDRTALEPVAKEVKAHFDDGWQKIKKYMPDLTAKQLEDYVTHIWDIPRHKQAEASQWFSTRNRFTEQRFIDTYKEGIERGYKPKTLDITEIIKIHDAVANRAIENARFINELLSLEQDGVPLVMRSVEAPLDWVEVNYPALTRRIPTSASERAKSKQFVKDVKVRVHPDLARPLKTIFEDRFDHPVISAYENINGVMKKSMLSLSLFHHGALGEVGIALGIPAKTANLYFNPVKIYKSLVKGEYEIFKNEPLARDAIEHGVQFGATSDIPLASIQKMLRQLSTSTENIPVANRVTKFLEGFNNTWDKALWDYLHDTLKLYGYESLIAKMPSNLDQPRTTMYKREMAQFINDTFGGQNWDTLGFSPKELQMMTWNLLSADWTLSTTRQALAPTGIGKVYNETAGARKKAGTIFWARAALYFGIGMNMLNAMFRQKDMEENPHLYLDKEYDFMDKTMFGNTLGNKTKLFLGRYNDGSERYLRWGKQFRDFFELFSHPIKKLGGKAAPVPQALSEIFTGHSLSGFKNDDIYGKEGLDAAISITKSLASGFIPISLQRYLNDNLDMYPLDIVMQSGKGMSRYKATEYFKKAILSSDEDMLVEVYEGALRNNLPAFSLFNYSLSWIEGEMIDKLYEDNKTIEDVEAKMAVSDDPMEVKRLGSILRVMQKEKADKEAGYRLLKSAINKADALHGMSKSVSSPRLH